LDGEHASGLAEDPQPGQLAPVFVEHLFGDVLVFLGLMKRSTASVSTLPEVSTRGVRAASWSCRIFLCSSALPKSGSGLAPVLDPVLCPAKMLAAAAAPTKFPAVFAAVGVPDEDRKSVMSVTLLCVFRHLRMAERVGFNLRLVSIIQPNQ